MFTTGMNFVRMVIAIFFYALSQALPFPDDSAVGTVWTFENETWIENLAVRENGEVLCTSINRAALYLVNPFEHVASLVHQFEPTDGLLGIAEVQNDVFVFASANISLATSAAYPGSAKMWKVDMSAWELVSQMLRPVVVQGLESDGLGTRANPVLSLWWLI